MKQNQTYLIAITLLTVSACIAFLLNDNITTKAVAYEPFTKEKALNSLIEAENNMQELKNSGLSVKFINDTLLIAKRSFIGPDKLALKNDINNEIGLKREYLESLLKVAESTSTYDIEKLDYSKTIELTKLIAERKKQAYALIDTISILTKRESEYKANNLDTSYAKELITKGQKSFDEERYNEAEDYLGQANMELNEQLLQHTKLKQAINQTRSFLSKYWKYLIIIFLILAAASVPAAKRARKYLAKKRIKSLNKELKSIAGSIKTLQEEYLKDKKIGRTTYDSRINDLVARRTKIKHTLPVLESIAYGKKEEDKKIGVLEVKK